MDIIYCAGGNTRLAQIAIEEGFLYGSRSDDIRNIRCNGIIDINWKKYNWENHKALVATHRPKYAVAPDIVDCNKINETIDLATSLQNFCSRVIIVPKIHGVISKIPLSFVVGISLPSSYAGFIPHFKELIGRDIHLLGGTPGQQRSFWKYYSQKGLTITSVDCNSHSKTSDFGSYWNGFKWCKVNSKTIGKYEVFRMSCQGIIYMWKMLGAMT